MKNAAGVRNLCEIVARTEGEFLVVVSAMRKTSNALDRVVAAKLAGFEQQAETE